MGIYIFLAGYLRSLRTSGSLTSMPSSTLGTNSSGTNNSALVNSLTDSTTTTSSPAFRQSYRSPYLRSDDSTDKHDDNNGKQLKNMSVNTFLWVFFFSKYLVFSKLFKVFH